MNRDAVIVRAGSKSSHARWVTGSDRAFDLIVAAYEDLPPALTAMASQYLLIPGSKVAGWNELFRSHSSILSRYEQIALLDDDLVCSGHDIERAFALGRRYHLKLWQPSLSWNSYFSHAVCLNNPLFRLRYVNFVEMMCPFFTSEQLGRTLPLFAIGLETGIDRLWCRLREDPDRAYAVLDEVVIEHSRPVGTASVQQGFTAERNPYLAPIRRMESVTGIRFGGPVAYAGVTRNEVHVRGRIAMAALSVVPLLGWRATVNKGWFYKPIFDHVRHNLTRPINNTALDAAELGRLIGANEPT